MTPHEALQLFISGGGSSFFKLAGQLHVFAAAVNAGHVEIRPFELPHATDPMKSTPEYEVFRSAFPKRTVVAHDDPNRAAQHGRLKWTAYSWLKTLGEPRPRFEHGFEHGYGVADVFGPALGIAVECGNTEPGKFFAAVESVREPVDRFVIFPFAWDSGGRDYATVHAIELYASTTARDALRADLHPLKEELRAKFMVRRRKGRPKARK